MLQNVLPKAAKLAGLAAVVGGVSYVAKKSLPDPKYSFGEKLGVTPDAALFDDRNMASLCDRFLYYAAVDKQACRDIVDGCAAGLRVLARSRNKDLCSMSPEDKFVDTKRRAMAMPRHTARHIGKVVASIRRLRELVQLSHGRNPTVMRDFDDIAASMQTALNNLQHNVNMTVEYQIAR